MMMSRSFSEKTRLQTLAIVVGLLCGLSAVILINLIHLIQNGLGFLFEERYDWVLYFLCPGLGMALSLLFVKFIVREDIGHGVTKVLTAISKNDSNISGRNTWASVVSSALTIGFGGSVGAEAPIVYTGAAIGSNIGRKAGLSQKNVTILLGCGAAAAIAAIFKAPLAGVLFTLEILMFNISMTSILPVLISSVTATVVTYLLIGNEVTFANSIADFRMSNLPFYLVLGVFCGGMSLYFIKATLKVEDRMRAVKKTSVRWAVSALALGMVILACPPLFGEGYGSLTYMLTNNAEHITADFSTSMLGNPWAFLLFAALVMFLKVFATALTNSGGGVGGTFGPTLVTGGFAGFVMARLINMTGLAVLPEANFALVGMAGMMAGVMQAPMTAIFLIAEITGGYELLLPLIITSIASFATIRTAEPYSIYTKRIAATGELLTHDSDQAVLTLLKTSKLIDTDFVSIRQDSYLGDVVEAVKSSSCDHFPVVDSQNHFCGEITLNDIRSIMFDNSAYDSVKVVSIMKSVPSFVYTDESMESVMAKFERTGAMTLPVLDDENKFLGYISKTEIFTSYRNQLKEFSNE